MVAPLAVLGLVLGRKKKRGKWDTFIALLVVCVVVGMSVSACGPEKFSPTPVPPTEEPTQPPTSTPSPTPKNENGKNPETSETSVDNPENGCGDEPAPTLMPTLTLAPTFATTSGYYIPTESQARDTWSGMDVPIPAPKWTNTKYLVRADLKTEDLQFSNNWEGGPPPQYANEVLLYDHNYTCLQGSAQLDNGEYITCQNPDGLWWDNFEPWNTTLGQEIRNKVSFLWADKTLINKLIPYNTVAVCDTSTISGTIKLSGLPIESLELLEQNGNPNAIFEVVDVGQGLCPSNSRDGGYHIDIFTGVGEKAYKDAHEHFFGKPVKIYIISP